MPKTVLVVYAHPEPRSLTRRFVAETIQTLERQGHTVHQSDLHGMGWKATFDEDDFPSRINNDRFAFIQESEHAYRTGQQTRDVATEQRKLLDADAVIFHFPLWWFGMPAILKGWIDRVYAYGFAYGYKGAGNRYRYGDGILKGKRALLSVMVGGPAQDYAPRGINGPLDELLFPITHGALSSLAWMFCRPMPSTEPANWTMPSRRRKSPPGVHASITSLMRPPFRSGVRTEENTREISLPRSSPRGKQG